MLLFLAMSNYATAFHIHLIKNSAKGLYMNLVQSKTEWKNSQ